MTAPPLQAPLCPICGKPNDCVVSAAGRFDVACWCKDAWFSTALLNAVPSELKGKACVCRTCAQDTHDHRTAQRPQG